MSDAHQPLAPAARQVYGTDPAQYDAGRPDYPDRVYEILLERCGLGPGARVLEIGPGTGIATRHLLAAGAEVVAVEPDSSLAGYLLETNAGRPLQVMPSTFEAAELHDEDFDLVTAATSFHWVDPITGLTEVGRVVRPGGWVALWWTIFGDVSRPDPFREATQPLIHTATSVNSPAPKPAPPSPAQSAASPQKVERRPMFELDLDQRQQDLRAQAGLENVEGELIRWTGRMTPSQVRGLYGSMILILRLDPRVREPLLDRLEEIAEEDFGGAVERPFITSIFTGRKPARP